MSSRGRSPFERGQEDCNAAAPPAARILSKEELFWLELNTSEERRDVWECVWNDIKSDFYLCRRYVEGDLVTLFVKYPPFGSGPLPTPVKILFLDPCLAHDP